MPWSQNIDPLQNIFLSAIVAAIPVLLIFILLLKKVKGYQASLLTLLSAFLITSFVYKMPLQLSALSALHGALYGLFPICWIIISAVFLFNLTVKSGQFEIIKSFMASITPDRRLQAILIAFSFGAFLEGAAGFGAPVAISGAMLVGLGFNPLYAAGICLIANTAPVAFGSVGTPILMASRMSDIPDMAISQMVGRTLPLLSVVLPWYLIILMCGWKKSLEVLPAIIVAGISFAFFQWFAANYMGPMLPDVLAGIASIFSMLILLKYWKPKSIWKFDNETEHITQAVSYSAGKIFHAWFPYIIMTLIIVAWGLPSVKSVLNSIGFLKINIPGLGGSILISDGTALPIKPFEFNYLSAPGTAVIIASLISIPFMNLTGKEAMNTFISTLKQLYLPILTVATVVGFAFVANYSGMSVTMATALATTGAFFPFFSPILGWLGVFLTGSDTSSNALFCKLQASSAETIGVDPVITVSANASGGVTGKMISPQSIAIGAASVGLIGKESNLFRFTVKHSFIMLGIISIITAMQAFVIKSVVPVYEKLNTTINQVNENITGKYVLGLLLLLIILLLFILKFYQKKKD